MQRAQIHRQVEEVLSPLGFKPVAKDIFVARPTDDGPEHFVYIHRKYSRHPNDSYIYADIGFRILQCDIFVMEAMRICLGEERPSVFKYVPKRSTLFELGFGFLGNEKAYGWDLWFESLSDHEFQERVSRKMEADIIPFFRKIDSEAKFFDLLAADDEPFRWFRCHPAYRACAVLFLGVRLGKDGDCLRSILQERKLELAGQAKIKHIDKFADCLFSQLSGRSPN